MMTLAGKNLRLFQPVPGQSKRMSPQAPLYPAMRGMALWVFNSVASASCAGGVAEYVNNGGNPMQYAKSVTLNVEECDRLSFLPYLFGNDFLYAEAYVYALAQKMMPEYQGGFWHFIRLPDGGGYMMPDGDRFHLVNGENWFDRTVSADAAGIILTSLVINRQLWLYHDSGDAGLTHLYRMRDAQLWSHIEFHPECNAIYAALD